MNDLDRNEGKKDTKVQDYLIMVGIIVVVISCVLALFMVNWGAVILGWLGLFGAIAIGIGAYVAFMSVSAELPNFPRWALKILIIIAAIALISIIIGLTW